MFQSVYGIKLGRAPRGPDGALRLRLRCRCGAAAYLFEQIHLDKQERGLNTGTGRTTVDHGACRPIPQPPSLRRVAIRHYGAPGLSLRNRAHKAPHWVKDERT